MSGDDVQRVTRFRGWRAGVGAAARRAVEPARRTLFQSDIGDLGSLAAIGGAVAATCVPGFGRRLLRRDLATGPRSVFLRRDLATGPGSVSLRRDLTTGPRSVFLRRDLTTGPHMRL